MNPILCGYRSWGLGYCAEQWFRWQEHRNITEQKHSTHIGSNLRGISAGNRYFKLSFRNDVQRRGHSVGRPQSIVQNPRLVIVGLHYHSWVFGGRWIGETELRRGLPYLSWALWMQPALGDPTGRELGGWIPQPHQFSLLLPIGLPPVPNPPGSPRAHCPSIHFYRPGGHKAGCRRMERASLGTDEGIQHKRQVKAKGILGDRWWWWIGEEVKITVNSRFSCNGAGEASPPSFPLPNLAYQKSHGLPIRDSSCLQHEVWDLGLDEFLSGQKAELCGMVVLLVFQRSGRVH